MLIIGFLIPQNLKMPVKGATKSDYNSKSFWFYPWGKSVTHKGIDIFAKKGTEINCKHVNMIHPVIFVSFTLIVTVSACLYILEFNVELINESCIQL